MKTYELIAPCHFGLEAVLKREIYDLGYEITKVEDGKISFLGDAEAVCRANIFLRTAERVLLKAGQFRAGTFEELFQGIREIPWEDFIPSDGRFWVAKASSVKSKLFSATDIQSVTKKAMVERLKGSYHTSWFPEDGADYPLRLFLLKDEVTVAMDTTGDSLHKRGYRLHVGKAPIRDAGGFPPYADALEKRPDPGRSFLRQRYVPHRGCYDGGQCGSGHEPQLYGRGLDKPDRAQAVAGGCGGSPGTGRFGDRGRYPRV